MKEKPNLAFIDGQNLYYGTKEDGWKIDFRRFRTYLRDKYHVASAYYFFGYHDQMQQALYRNLQSADFILSFREHTSNLKGTKKGNVDTDIVFEVMKALMEQKDFSKILLISSDGDYKKMVDYLIQRERFQKILFPSKRRASSLYRQLLPQYFDHLDRESIRNKIAYKK